MNAGINFIRDEEGRVSGMIHSREAKGENVVRIYGCAAFIANLRKAGPLEDMVPPKLTEDGLQTHAAEGWDGRAIPVFQDDERFPFVAGLGEPVLKWPKVQS